MAIWWRGVRSAAEAANLPAAYSFGRSIRCLHQYETIQAIPREATGRRVSARDRTIGRIPAVVFTQSLLETDASKRGVSRKQLLTADRKQIKSIVDSVGLPFFCSTTFKAPDPSWAGLFVASWIGPSTSPQGMVFWLQTLWFVNESFCWWIWLFSILDS